MSKRSKEKKPAPLADWEVVIDRLGGAEDMPAVHVIPASRHWREKSGWHVFTDDEGLAAEFAPGAVLSVTRLMRGAAKAEVPASGGSGGGTSGPTVVHTVKAGK